MLNSFHCFSVLTIIKNNSQLGPYVKTSDISMLHNNRCFSHCCIIQQACTFAFDAAPSMCTRWSFLVIYERKLSLDPGTLPTTQGALYEVLFLWE